MMAKLIFHSLLSLMLVVSCECKDMHIRRMPEEKDIAFKGEVKTPQKAVYRKGQSREIQVHLTSSDEEAKDAQFKILSATLADLTTLCRMQLRGTLSDEEQSLVAAVNATDRFGKKAWEHYFGEVDEEPALPDNINEILDSDCPFGLGKKIKETHLLVMIPTTVGGELFTPSQMIQLAQNPQKGMGLAPKTKKNRKTVRRGDRIGLANALHDSEEDITARCLRDLARKGPSHAQPYWILMTRDVVNTTGNTNPKDLHPEYDLPTVLEASTVILTHYVSTAQWLYERVHTYCQETTVDKDRSFFTGKSNRHNRLIIDNKMRTAIKIEGGDAPSENIPHALRGQGLLRRL